MMSSSFLGGIVVGTAATLAVTYFFNKTIKNRPEDKEKGEDIKVEKTKSRSAYALASGVEHVSFLTEIIAQLWQHINVAGAKTIKETCEPMFKDMLPGPLSKMHFTKVDLGKVPIRMDNMIVHEIENGAVQFDMDIIWNGDCDIQLKADYVGSFGVKTVKLSGRMAILLKPLMDDIPVIQGIQYAFVNPPELELDFTGLAQIADFAIIDKAIRKIIMGTLESMMVLPFRMVYRMDRNCSLRQIYHHPIGVLRVTALKGRGFQAETRVLRKVDIPDVYLNIRLGPRECRTTTIPNSLEPEWNESADFLLCDYEQYILIHAFDEDSGRLDADDDLGITKISVGDLLLVGGTKELELTEKQRGTGAYVTVNASLLPLTSEASSFETETSRHSLTGLLTIMIIQAFNLPVPKESAASFVKIKYGDFESTTSVISAAPGVDAINPLYDYFCDIPLVAGIVSKKIPVELVLINGNAELGATTITHESLVNAPNKTISERRKIGDKGASIDLSLTLCGIQVDRSLSSNTPTTSRATGLAPKTSIGTVRITAVSGKGFKPQKRRLRKDDIPDLYCIIKFGSQEWRTRTIKNSIVPEWNESKEFPLRDHGHYIDVDVFDEDSGKFDKDDYLGSGRITVGKLLLSGGLYDLHLEKDGKSTDCFITFRCHMV